MAELFSLLLLNVILSCSSFILNISWVLAVVVPVVARHVEWVKCCLLSVCPPAQHHNLQFVEEVCGYWHQSDRAACQYGRHGTSALSVFRVVNFHLNTISTFEWSTSFFLVLFLLLSFVPNSKCLFVAMSSPTVVPSYEHSLARW